VRQIFTKEILVRAQTTGNDQMADPLQAFPRYDNRVIFVKW